MKKDIFLIILWLIFGLAGVYFIALMLYIATGLNVETDIAPYNHWHCDEAFWCGLGGMICTYASIQSREWYFESDTTDNETNPEE